jgi:hypothetical protein
VIFGNFHEIPLFYFLIVKGRKSSLGRHRTVHCFEGDVNSQIYQNIYILLHTPIFSEVLKSGPYDLLGCVARLNLSHMVAGHLSYSVIISMFNKGIHSSDGVPSTDYIDVRPV